MHIEDAVLTNNLALGGLFNVRNPDEEEIQSLLNPIDSIAQIILI